MENRAKAIACVYRICDEQADELGRMELEETKIGRLDHKIEKLKIVKLVPGIEFLRCDARSGDHGLTITEYAPFGVIGAVTPVTHSLPTLAGNVVNMLAAGNTVVFNPHPSGRAIACEGVRRFNKAIDQAIGVENLITIIGEPTLETAGGVLRSSRRYAVGGDGRPGIARAALASKKRAIVAGPGNPPVVVDETADIENAARSIVKGAAYDNNLLCIGEKEVFAVERSSTRCSTPSVATAASPESLAGRAIHQARLFAAGEGGRDTPCSTATSIGKDAAVLASLIGVRVPAGTQILYGETDTNNPFVPEEQMMPFVPFVAARDAMHAIDLAREFEHNFKHTSLIHSRNVRTMTMHGPHDGHTLFVKNGPCSAGLGLGGQGYLSTALPRRPAKESPTR